MSQAAQTLDRQAAPIVERRAAATLARQPALPTAGPSYLDLRRRVIAAGLMEPTHRFYVLFVSFTLGLTGAVIAAIIVVGASWWSLGIAALLPFLTMQYAFIGHDGGHRQVFRTTKRNDWFVMLTSTIFMGFSLSWWMDQHNRHHGMPNHEDLDPNINIAPFAFTPAQLQRKRGLSRLLTKYQGWLVTPLNMLGAINKHVENIRYLYSSQVRYPVIEPILTAVHIGGYLALLFLVLEPLQAVAFIAVHYALFGLYLGAVIAPNHKGMPMVHGLDKLDFLYWQVLTARNIRGNRVIDYLYGGLNYQIEHHLFPTMPRPHLPAARKIVRRYCLDYGIEHHETGVVGAYTEIISSMHRISAPLRGGSAENVPPVLDAADVERMKTGA